MGIWVDTKNSYVLIAAHKTQKQTLALKQFVKTHLLILQQQEQSGSYCEKVCKGDEDNCRLINRKRMNYGG